jgi:hypothetical protein
MIHIVRHSRSRPETQPRRQPALLIIGDDFPRLHVSEFLTDHSEQFAVPSWSVQAVRSLSVDPQLALRFASAAPQSCTQNLFLPAPLYVLFEELIEQHRVHSVVADGVWFASLVAGD